MIIIRSYNERIFKYKKEVIERRYSLIDELLEMRDVFFSYLRGHYLFKWKALKNKFIFKDIDITVFCQNELKFSFNRVVRLLMCEFEILCHILVKNSYTICMNIPMEGHILCFI